MPRPQKQPMRPLTEQERQKLILISQSPTAPPSHAVRARGLLAVADGKTYAAAARECGQASGDTVAHWVARFNKEGLRGIAPRHGGGRPPAYTERDKELILEAARRDPDPLIDGTHVWSLTSLRRRLESDGLPTPSVYTLWNILRAAGIQWLEKQPRRGTPATRGNAAAGNAPVRTPPARNATVRSAAAQRVGTPVRGAVPPRGNAPHGAGPHGAPGYGSAPRGHNLTPRPGQPLNLTR